MIDPSRPDALTKGEQLADPTNTDVAIGQAPSPPAGEGGAPLRAPGEGASRQQTMRNRARSLRQTQTDAEARLWRLLRSRRFSNVKFRRQVVIGPFIADFLSYEFRLIIEADGGQHCENDRDVRRNAWMRVNGFNVLRFWNNDILSNIEGVATAILATLNAPPPPPAREGRATLSRKGRGNVP